MLSGSCNILFGGEFIVLGPLFQKDGFEGLFALGAMKFGLGSQVSVLLVEGDVFNRFNKLSVLGGFGQVGAGDLEGVEEQTGAAWVELVRCYPPKDEADRLLDGGAVFRERQVEGGVRVGVQD